MSKKNRKSRKVASMPPDEHFAAGPFEFARFDRFVMGRSHLTAADIETASEKLAEKLPTITAEIDDLVQQIAEQVARLPGERLLHRAWWEFAMTIIRKDGPSGFDQISLMRMIDYVQSVIAAVEPAEDLESDVGEDEWKLLSERIQTLFTRLTLEYQIAVTAFNRRKKESFDMSLEEFRYQAEVMWMNVRGKRYQCHEKQALEDILTPHSDVLVRLFGIDAQTLIEELDKILVKLTHGIHDLFSEIDEFRSDTTNRLAELAVEFGDMDIEVLRDKMFEDPAFDARRQRVSGELFGFDLFDVEKNTNLPKALLDELTWSPGEEEDFFAAGPFRGWPVRIWPTMRRPFIRLRSRTFCFDMFALFDNFYRIVQRIVFRLAPDYRTAWNERQKAVSEELPFKYFSRLLPGAKILRPVYYRWKSGDGPAQWHEADGLVIYDDHLIVVEVKAGAFTYTSPAMDLPAHIDSLSNLARNPATQGNRFVDYLESAPEVIISNSNHEEIFRLRRSAYRRITILAITLDSFTELAARANHLIKVGVDMGKRPVWLLSVDDMRVYADMFENPLTFLHFIEQRMASAQSEIVDLNDEMDHLGLYLQENNYSMYAAELMSSEKVTLRFDGYRTQIDEIYSAVVRGEPLVAPRQKMPMRIAEIIEFLKNSQTPRRSEIASFLLDASGEYRDTISHTIDEQIQSNAEIGRPKPCSTYGNHAFTLWVWSPPVQRNVDVALTHTLAVISAGKESARIMLEVECDTHGKIVDVHWSRISSEGLSESEFAEVEKSAVQLKKSRVAAVKSARKIGVNEACPCGSGVKFKKCCR